MSVLLFGDPVDILAASIDGLFEQYVSDTSDISLPIGQEIVKKDDAKTSLTKIKILLTIEKAVFDVMNKVWPT